MPFPISDIHFVLNNITTKRLAHNFDNDRFTNIIIFTIFEKERGILQFYSVKPSWKGKRGFLTIKYRKVV